MAIALLLRLARCPGAAVIGGLIAGILLGPGILGRTAPDAFERLFVGGAAERVALEEAQREHEAERMAWTEAGTNPTPDLLDAQLLREQDLQQEWDAARWSFQRPLRSYGSTIILITLLAAGLTRRGGDRRPWSSATSIGMWSALVPGGLAMIYFALSGRPLAGTLLGVAAVAIGPFILEPTDRDAADGAEIGGATLVDTAGRVASILAILAAMIGAALTRTTIDAIWCLPLLALPLGWILPAFPPDSAGERRLRAVLNYGAVPILAAVAAQRVDFFDGFRFLPTLAFLLLSADCRWLGAIIGAVLPGGRRGMRTARLVLGSMACAPTQLAVIVVAAELGALGDTDLTGLLLGAALIGLAAPLRRSLADQLAEAEAIVDDAHDDSSDS